MIGAPVLLLLAVVGLQDPVRVQTGLSRAEIHAGETTVLRVDVETDGARAEIQRLTRLPPGVELVGTRDYDQRQFSLPGGTRRFVTREFILRPRVAGVFRIPAVSATVAGRTYTSASQVLTVTQPPPGLRPPTATGSPDSEVALHAWLETDTAYVGEQVTMQAEAMFSNAARLRLRRAPEYEAPSPAGFWIDDLPDRRTATTRIIDGTIYEVQGFRRAFFPLSPGRHVIPPARLEYEMRRGILYAPETFEVLSDSMPLLVLPIPEEGRPAEFTGAVGRFTARGSLEPAEVPAGEAAVLTVEVEGVGNVKALPPPRLPDLPGVEVFPPSEDAETEIREGVVSGRKSFSWVLIPERAGVLELPPIRYAYFDPDAERFGSAGVDGLSLRVAPGAAPAIADARPSTLRYLRTEPAADDPLAWVETPWFALLQLVPLLAFAAGWTASRDRPGVSRRDLRRRRRAALRDLERRAAGDDPALLPDLEAFARGWIAERLGIRPTVAGRASTLEAAGVPTGVAASAAKALERLAANRFAPTPPPPERRNALVKEIAAVLERLDREAPAPGRSGASPAAAAILLVLLATAAGPRELAALQEPADSEFRHGIEAFDAERFLESAAAFEDHVRHRPDDPAGWYNLGTAYYRGGHPGYAVWAWLNALRLDPRDEDARHNLAVAGTRPELMARAVPAIPLRSRELALLASIAWFLAGGAGALWLARRERRRGAVAGVALAAAIGAGAAWLVSTNAPETLIVLETATLRAGPTLGGEPLEDLEPGSGLVPVARYGEWIRARTLDGREGWIENRSAGAL